MGDVQSRPVNFKPRLKIDGTALTSSYQQIFAGAESRATILLILNSCDQTIFLSLPKKGVGAATDDHFELGAGESFVLDIGANGDFSQNEIWAKHGGVVPTSGTLRIMRVE
jgi:hypothetical protein